MPLSPQAKPSVPLINKDITSIAQTLETHVNSPRRKGQFLPKISKQENHSPPFSSVDYQSPRGPKPTSSFVTASVNRTERVEHMLQQIEEQQRQLRRKEREQIQQRELDYDKIIDQMLPHADVGIRKTMAHEIAPMKRDASCERIFDKAQIFDQVRLINIQPGLISPVSEAIEQTHLPKLATLDAFRPQADSVEVLSAEDTPFGQTFVRRQTLKEKFAGQLQGTTKLLQLMELSHGGSPSARTLTGKKDTTSLQTALRFSLSNKKFVEMMNDTEIDDLSQFGLTSCGKSHALAFQFQRKLKDFQGNSRMNSAQKKERALRKEILDYKQHELLKEEIIEDPVVDGMVSFRAVDQDNQDSAVVNERKKMDDMLCLLLQSNCGEDFANQPTTVLVEKIHKKINENLDSFPQLSNVYGLNLRPIFINQTEYLLADLANEIKAKLSQQEVGKNFTGPCMNELHSEDYQFRFFKKCNEGKVQALPLIQKIQNRKLILTDYALNTGLCESLVVAFQVFPNIINTLCLAQNGLKDDQLAIILHGIKKLHQIENLIIKRNELCVKSTEALLPLLAKKFPESLREFRLLQCKISLNCTTKICDSLSSHCHLRKLSLVQAQIGSNQAPQIAQVIRNAKFLTDIDLSWNRLTSIPMFKIIEALSENRKLQYCNLSWNQFSMNQSSWEEQFMVDVDEEIIKIKQKFRAENQNLDPTSVSYRQNVEDQNKLIEKVINRPPNLELQDYEEKVEDIQFNRENWTVDIHMCQLITTFMKKNRNLQHLNLDNTFLTEYMIWTICKCLKRAPSLLNLHISGNPGVNTQVKSQIRRRLVCIPYQQERKLHLMFDSDAVSQTIGVGGKKEEKIKQQLHVRQFQRMPQPQNQMNTQIIQAGLKFVLQRHIGHKDELPGSGQWKLLEQPKQKCWLCNLNCYTLIFWTESWGRQETAKFTSQQFNDSVHQLELINSLTKNSLTQPSQFCQMSNWHPQQMMTLKEFFYKLDKSRPDFIKELKERGQIRDDVEDESQLDADEQHLLSLVVRQHQNKNYSSAEDIKSCLVKSCGYKKPMLINSEVITALDDDYSNREDIYVIVQIFRPGRHLFSTCLPQKNGLPPKFFLHRILVQKRDEEPAVRAKTVKTRTFIRVFDKRNSVFRDWLPDTKEVLFESMDHDMKLWRCGRFIKSDFELESVMEAVKNNAQLLKILFVQIISRGSNYPYISWNDFTSMCSQAGIIDKRGAQLATVDRVFITVDQDGEMVMNNQPKTFMRYQFLEGLVRIGNCKYRETGQTSSFADSFNLLIKNCIKPFYPWLSWQDWRESNLWTLEVNDVYQINMDGIRALMTHYYGPNKKTFNRNDCFLLFMRDTNINISEKDFNLAFGMSKMLVCKEATKEHKDYFQVKLVELLEIIGRVAEAKYSEESDLSICKKIELILDNLFMLTHFTRREVGSMNAEESVSDEDY